MERACPQRQSQKGDWRRSLGPRNQRKGPRPRKKPPGGGLRKHTQLGQFLNNKFVSHIRETFTVYKLN